MQAQLLQGPTPRTGRFDIDAAIDKSAALKPWLADAGKVPLPMVLKTTLKLTTGALHADPLKLSIAGQALNGSASLRNAKPWQ